MPGTWDTTGEIYKAELDGTVLGKFGRPGKLAPGFQVVHRWMPQSNEIVVAKSSRGGCRNSSAPATSGAAATVKQS
jgi:hypothetical protein